MTHQTDTPNFFNPLLLWADWGMRAAEATIASTQNLTEGADRVTRAVAGTEASEIADAQASEAEASAAAAFDGIANMQRQAWDTATQNWTQWMSAVGGMLSAGAGRQHAVALANPKQRRSERDAEGSAQHAFASDEPKPRRKAAAKTRRTKRASRK